MKILDKTYIFEKARNKHTGEVLERESRRKGHKLKFDYLEIDVPLVYSYLEGGFVRTSKIESFEVKSKEVVVTTINSIYTFSEAE